MDLDYCIPLELGTLDYAVAGMTLLASSRRLLDTACIVFVADNVAAAALPWKHTGGSQQKLKEEHEHRPRIFVLQLPLRDAVVICMTTAALFGSRPPDPVPWSACFSTRPGMRLGTSATSDELNLWNLAAFPSSRRFPVGL